MKSENVALLGVGIILFGLWLASRPNCNRGCQTMAQHLISHGLDDFIAGIVSA